MAGFSRSSLGPRRATVGFALPESARAGIAGEPTGETSSTKPRHTRVRFPQNGFLLERLETRLGKGEK
jgi:hypothetical protein